MSIRTEIWNNTGMCRIMRAASICVVTSLVLTSLAQAQTVARSGFEASESYTVNWDVRYQNHTDFGWTDAKWGGYKGGGVGGPFTSDPLTVPINDGTAPQGVQYYRQHRADNTSTNIIDIARHFPEQFGRVYYSFKVRMDSAKTSQPYFQSAADFYVYNALAIGGSSIGGKRAVHFQFLADGTIKVKAASSANDVVVGKWDGTGTLASALGSWRTIVVDADVTLNTYKLYYEGTDLHATGGTFNFRETVVGGTTTLNGVRYLGPRGFVEPAPSNYWDWGMSLDDIYIGTDVPPPPPQCDSSVSPSDASMQTSFAVQGQAASPGSFVYTIGNNAGVSHDYIIQEVDAGGSPLNHGWLYLDGGLDTTTRTIGAAAIDTVTVTIDTTGLTAGTYIAYLRFTDDCSPTTDMRRTIELTVKDCWWSITPGNIVVPQCPASTQRVFTITNHGVVDINYTVEKIVDCLNLLGEPWLQLDKSGGMIPAGQTDTVTATINAADMPLGDSACDLLFLRDCDSGDPTSEVIRTVTLRTLSPFRLEYKGDVAPDAMDSAGPGRTFVRQAGVGTLGSVADDSAASDGKAWWINDTDPTANAREFWRSDPTDNLDGANGATMVARMKVISETDSDAHLRISNNGGNSAALHWGGPSGQVAETTRSQLASIAGDGKYHIFRMCSFLNQNNLATVKIYVDENPTPVLEIPNGAGMGLSPDGFGFGVLGNTGMADIYFDWITASNAGAFAPGEEEGCIGQSLLLSPPGNGCNTPQSDLNGDNSVDGADYGLFAGCFNGTGNPINVGCECADLNDDLSVDGADYGLFAGCFNGTGNPSPCS